MEESEGNRALRLGKEYVARLALHKAKDVGSPIRLTTSLKGTFKTENLEEIFITKEVGDSQRCLAFLNGGQQYAQVISQDLRDRSLWIIPDEHQVRPV